jgi:hypothetical protein
MKKDSSSYVPQKRKLQSGRIVSEEKKSAKLIIDTTCPNKWLFVDLETGDVWHSVDTPNSLRRWRTATQIERLELKNLRIAK